MAGFANFSRRFALPLWKWYLGGFLALAVTNIITLEIPQLAKTVVNTIDTHTGMGDAQRLALMIIGLGVVQILVRSLSRIMIFWPGRDLEARSRAHLFDRAMALPYAFFVRFGMGDLISRLSNDLGQLRIFYAFGVLQALNLVYMSVFTIAKMLSVHAALTGIALIPILMMLVVTGIVWPAMQRNTRVSQEALGRLTNRITEAFVNVHAIQANAANQAFVDRSEAENLAVYRSNMKVILLRTFFFPLMTCMTGVAQLLVLFYGSYETIAGRLTVGDILAFNIYLGYLSFPLSALGILLAIFQRAVTSLERLAPFEDETPEQAEALVPIVPNSTAPVLELKNLNFSYPLVDGKERSFALKNINLKVAPGQRIGIFGAVGAGKTTLFNLITRVVAPSQNAAFFEGADVLHIKPQTLRRAVAYGLQSVHLFSDSVEGNLAFGLDHPPTPEALRKALAHAEILTEVEGFEEGLKTQIGEKGIRLSGGQKQRIALARLFLRQPRLLILDDVLAAVDNQTERRIMDYIYSTGASLLIASHRPSALRACDEILMLSDGMITDRGTFAQLAPRYPELREEQGNGL